MVGPTDNVWGNKVTNSKQMEHTWLLKKPSIKQF